MRLQAPLLIALALAAGAMAGDELPRRGYLGLQFDLADRSGPGLLVSAVAAGSTADQAGLRVGDRLTSVGGVASLGDFSELRDELARTATGERIALRWYRGANRVFRAAPALGPLPGETVPGGRSEYEAVPVGGARLRLILTQPEDPAPGVIFYLQELGCESIDFWLDTQHPAKRLIDAWAAAGYATARLEKRGIGDSEGGPCAELDLDEERRGFLAALLRLSELGYGGRVVLFGQGTGGVLAPGLATAAVSSVVVYGAPAVPWFDYVTAMLERQDRLLGLAESEVAARQTLRAAFQKGLLFEGQTPAALVSGMPGASALPEVRAGSADHYAGRSVRFFEQLAAIDPERAWRQVWQPVLALHGEFDWTATRADQQAIARLTGGKFQSLPRLGPDLMRYESMAEAFLAAGTGVPAGVVAEATLTWLRAAAAKPPGELP